MVSVLPTEDKFPVDLNQLTLWPVQLPELYIQLEGRVLETLADTGTERSILSAGIVDKYFYFKILQPFSIDVLAANRQICQTLGALS